MASQGNADNITLCHASPPDQFRYEGNEPLTRDPDSIVKTNGHDSHPADIIPAFTYQTFDKDPYGGSYPGKNLDKLSWIANGCKAPSPAQPSIVTSQQPATAVVGSLLMDQATLFHSNDATGTITFNLIDPTGTNVHHETVTVNALHTVYLTTEGHIASTAGTWYWTASYSGDAGNNPATSGDKDEPVTVNKADPSITTTQTPSAGVVGITLQDSATLSHGYHPTNTITFFLNDSQGHNLYHETVDVTSGNGTYSTVHGYTPLHSGTYYWVATYNGDANNNTISSGATDEQVVLTAGPVTPVISTTPMPGTAKVGEMLNDKATLTGSNSATGSIVFTLLDPNDHQAYEESVDVTAFHTVYTTVHGFMAYMPGTWHWIAAYSGDTNNKAVTSLAGDEPVTVNKADPSISTTQDPTSAVVGATLKDSATLSGYHPTGTITFNLNDSTGTSIFHETVDVTNGNGIYLTAHGFTTTSTGTFYWVATYNGDPNNNTASSGAKDEPVVVTSTPQPTTPTIKTTPNPTSALMGATLNDSATLSGGSNPTGTITFTLYNPSGTAVHIETVNVTSGNGTYSTTTGHVADAAGTWHWKAAYSGDQNNAPVASNAADEPVIVGPTGEVLAQTGANPPGFGLALSLIILGMFAMGGALLLYRRSAA